ncbi:MAG: hypothetical protein QOI35_1091 [Cryptosporangiaceae bacterium]|nr:hypothetical protein [Cryptosporangiaceae bacterium]MDQ1658452.1 hypothetical protein [Cryptosporangiaceae bacterium]
MPQARPAALAAAITLGVSLLTGASPASAAPPAGYELVSSPDTSFGRDGTLVAVAKCPPGKKVIGGGARPMVHDVDVNVSALTPVPAMMPGMSELFRVVAAGRMQNTLSFWKLRAYAVCADPLPGLTITTSVTPSNGDDNKILWPDCPAGKFPLANYPFLTGGAVGRVQILSNYFEPGGSWGAQAMENHSAPDEGPDPGNWSLGVKTVCADPIPGLTWTGGHSASTAGPRTTASALCPAGQHALSFGFYTSSGSADLETLAPNGDGTGVTATVLSTVAGEHPATIDTAAWCA